MEDPRKIYTLIELGKSLRSVIERNYSSSYWIKAEIAKLNYYPRSGHCYPELVHKSDNAILAQMRSTIWAGDFKQINTNFKKIAGDELREGMLILFRATVTYHPVYGLSLQIWEVEPSFTLGEMALEKAKAIERLKSEEIFDKNKTLQLPLLPKRIAVISVETSKGYHDFLNILKSYDGKYAIWHFLFPTVLQGEKAVEGIISQLRIIRKAVKRFDMVAIIRGGGGDIGLSCYDDYAMAREIALFPLPVITGIGHSTNETIAEMVAWDNKITPTDVGYFIIEKFRDFEQRIDHIVNTLNTKVFQLLDQHKRALRSLNDTTVQVPLLRVAKEKEAIHYFTGQLSGRVSQYGRKEAKRLDNLAFEVATKPGNTILSQKFSIEKQQIILNAASIQRLNLEKAVIRNQDQKIHLLDPRNIMERGFSITTFKDKNLVNANELSQGDTILTKLKNGEIISVVSKTKQ